jgi:hypothetical protein
MMADEEAISEIVRKCNLPQEEAQELAFHSIKLYRATAEEDDSSETISLLINDILYSLYSIANSRSRTKKSIFNDDVKAILPNLFQRILMLRRTGNKADLVYVWDLLGCFCKEQSNGQAENLKEYLESQSVLISDILTIAAQSLGQLVLCVDCVDSMECAYQICSFVSNFASANSKRQRLVGSCPALIPTLVECLRNFSRVPAKVSAAVSVAIVNIHGRILLESSDNAVQLLRADGFMVLYSILNSFVSTGEYLLNDVASDLLYRLFSAFGAACTCIHSCKGPTYDFPKVDLSTDQIDRLRGTFCTVIDSLPNNLQLTHSVASAVIQFSESYIKSSIEDKQQMLKILEQFLLAGPRTTLLTRMFRLKNHPNMSHMLDTFLTWFGKVGALSFRIHEAIDREFDKLESGNIEIQGPSACARSAFNSSSPNKWDTEDVATCAYVGCANNSRITGYNSMKKCGKCKKVFYCGKEHQLLHWKSGHKQVCTGFTASTK